MARPEKQGIDYYSMDTGFYNDFKVRRIQNDCGPLTGSVLTCLLGAIYANGYHLKWEKDLPSLIAVNIGTRKEGAVSEIINKAAQVDFFDQEKFQVMGVLTSKGIQKRYLEATVRRKTIYLDKNIWLIEAPEKAIFLNENVNINPQNVYINPQNVDINPQNVCKSTQSKVKESKVSSSQPKPSKKTTTTTEKKSGIFDASAFLPKADQIEDQKTTLQSGLITATPGQINAFLKVIGAFQASETEKMNLSQAIAAGCTPEHLQILLEEKPNITSFKADWVIRELIAVKRKSDKTSRPSEDALTAELEKTYGRI